MSLDAAISGLVSRLESVTARLETLEKQIEGGSSAPSSGGASSGGDSASLKEFDDLVVQHINPYVELSGKLGDSTALEQAQLVLQAINAQKDLLKIASTSKKPSDQAFQGLIQPMNDIVHQVVALRDANRASKFFNNLSAISEGLPALNWSPTPAPYVGDMRAGSEFYSNRVLKEFKGKDQTQVEWVQAFNGFLKDLQAWIRKYHTTGLEWNANGGDAPVATPSAPKPAAPAPTPTVTTTTRQANTGGLFAELSKGADVTQGLKKVTSDMKAKNQTGRTAVVPSGPKKATPAKKTTAPAKPPRTSLDGNKWNIEYHEGNREIVISETEPKQSCYIFRCNNSTIQVKGKVNAIILGTQLFGLTTDDCSRTSVVFDDALASFEIVNCRSVEIQVTGKVPTFAVDKTSGCQIYLSESSLDSEIITSKSDEMNISLPTASGDLVELAVPEQYKTTVENGKLVTTAVQHM